jgi:hypothetical protein
MELNSVFYDYMFSCEPSGHIFYFAKISVPTHEQFKAQREKNKIPPAQPIRHDYLLSGHLKCSCNLTWQARTATHRRSRKREWIERQTPLELTFVHNSIKNCDCQPA